MTPISPELQLAQQKIAELTKQISALTNSDHELVVLPNGDLHRGIRPELQNLDPDVHIIPAEFGNPLNKAMAQILSAAKGSDQLTCLWCGLQFYGQHSEKEVREHLKKNHAAIAVGTNDAETAQVLMATLEDTKAQLEKASR